MRNWQRKWTERKRTLWATWMVIGWWVRGEEVSWWIGSEHLGNTWFFMTFVVIIYEWIKPWKTFSPCEWIPSTWCPPAEKFRRPCPDCHTTTNCIQFGCTLFPIFWLEWWPWRTTGMAAESYKELSLECSRFQLPWCSCTRHECSCSLTQLYWVCYYHCKFDTRHCNSWWIPWAFRCILWTGFAYSLQWLIPLPL